MIRRVKWAGALVLLFSVGLSGATLAAAPPIAYSLTPLFSQGKLIAVAVTIEFQGGKDGRMTVDLPDKCCGVKGLWKEITNIQVSGARVRADGPAKRILTYTPGARIIFRYLVHSAYRGEPPAEDENPYNGAVILPRSFESLGEFLFAEPHGRDRSPATFKWQGWPRNWTHASDADHWRYGRAMTAHDVLESTLIAAPGATLITRPITGGVLRMIALGRWKFGTAHYADLVARVVSAQRQFWGDVRGPFTVSLFQLPASPHVSMNGGTGRSDGFALYATPDIPEQRLLFTIAHEHTHTWIPRRLGSLPKPNEIAGYWLSEGFTDFYAQRTLLRSGIWTPNQLVAYLNRTLLDYATSPARAYPNSRIVSGFWSNDAVGQLPYLRGDLFAYLIDRRLRIVSHGRLGLDQVMFKMRDRWAAAPAAAKPELIPSFIETVRSTGLDIRKEIAKYIDAGDPISLPPDLFPGCVRVASLNVPKFDPGFGRAKSAGTGVIAGVDPNGPAFRAGLRNGMKRIAKVAGAEGDSRITMSYRIAGAAGERVINWKPAGKGLMALQEASLVPNLTPSQLAACARTMSGE